MNKLKQLLIVMLVGDYVLDKMTEPHRIEVFPSPYKYLRNKLLFAKEVKHE